MAPQPTATPNEQSTDQWAAQLASLVDSQVERYQSLAQITRVQSEAVENADTDALLSALAKRQVVIKQITDANATLNPFIAAWNAHESQIPPALTTTIRQSMGKLDVLVEEINAADERDRKALEAKRTAISSELAGVNQKRTAINAYAGKPQAGARFQDRRG